MPNISIFSGDFSNGSSVVKELLDRTGCSFVTDNNLVARAEKLSGMSESSIESAFLTKTSVFNKFTREKERAMAYLKLAMAEMLSGQNQLMSGYLAHLAPHSIT
ncbi:MAG: response regulator, partial [Desulfobulbaceae bacterium]|nr:response regulator [Desulfobulbaceae bacterium]